LRYRARSADLEARDEAWREQIRCEVLDLSGPYRKTFHNPRGWNAPV
jgi:hypothetical protein